MGIVTSVPLYTWYPPVSFPLSGNVMIAPFWNGQNSYRLSGKVYYQLSTEQSLLDQVATQISDTFRVTFTPESVFVATWDGLGVS